MKAQLKCDKKIILIEHNNSEMETFNCAVFPCIEIKMIGSKMVENDQIGRALIE